MGLPSELRNVNVLFLPHPLANTQSRGRNYVAVQWVHGLPLGQGRWHPLFALKGQPQVSLGHSAETPQGATAQ